MEPITDFYIMCYHDIYEALADIYKKIEIPTSTPRSITYVFDEEQSVRWNREQVEVYNRELSDARKNAIETRNQSLRNLDRAVIDYMAEYEAKDTTPRSVLARVVSHAQRDRDDDWWNYLGDYLDFAEDILSIAKEN